MNPVIQAQLREFAATHSIQDDRQERQFEVYSIFSIMTGLLGEPIDPYEVYLPGDEFGLDGIAILVQGESVRNETEAEEKLSAIRSPSVEFIFFQSKTSPSFDYGEISKFFDAISCFFDGSLADESPIIADLTSAATTIYAKGVGKRNPKISCYYVSTGNYEKPQRIEKLRDAFRKQLEEKNIFDNLTIKIELSGARDLQQWYRTATSSVEVEIDFPRNVVMPPNQHVEEAYIGYVDAGNLLRLFTNKNDSGATEINRSVFFDNIRDYDPKSEINASIKEGVRSRGGAEFVFRNNGITVVSKNIDRTGDRFRLEDFQIVNGCQTSNIIYDLVYGTIDEEGAEGLNTTLQVPFRLIGSKDDDFVSSIIIGTNRQNPVRDEQFWALRPFMKSFEEYCRNLGSEEVIFFERRENQYRNVSVERTRVMQPSVLMKAVAACLLFQPQRAARDYRGLLSEYEHKIFLEEHDVVIYHAVSFLYYRLEFLWRNQRIDSNFKTFRYYILAGIGLVLTDGFNVFNMKKAKATAFCKDLLDLCKNEDRLKRVITQLASIVEDRLKDVGVTTQERARDAIRSEAFSAMFRERVMAHSW